MLRTISIKKLYLVQVAALCAAMLALGGAYLFLHGGGTIGLVHVFVAVFLVVFCGGAVAGFLIMNRKLFMPLQEISSGLDRIARGDFTVEIESTSEDEVGYIKEKMEEMVSNMKQKFLQLTNNANQVASASGDLSKTVEELSGGLSELAPQAEQVATAMTEVSQTIMDMARNASHSADASKNSTDAAAKGKGIVDTTAKGMLEIAATVQNAATTIEELGKSSAQIGEIVAVINGIADQTNLLALNAAIEAARAGEQGRGFAVVADEVRKLAERTGQATKDITQRIAAIQSAAGESVDAMKRGSDEVDRGVGLAKEASTSLDSIVAASTNAMDMVQRIAAATEEQSAASEEVTQNMENISSITKRSSSSTEHIKASAKELAKLASGLKNTTAWFKV
jgi:methyl-accepting chemotaxis protein